MAAVLDAGHQWWHTLPNFEDSISKLTVTSARF